MGRTALFPLLKAAVSILLIWLLLDRIDIGEMGRRFQFLSLSAALLGLLFLACQVFAVTQRWTLICRAMGVDLRFSQTLRILVIGLFFNQTLPSSIGGDAVRVWLVTREGASLGKAVSVVLGDRVLGLLVLIGIMGLALPLLYERVADTNIRLGVTLVVAVPAIAFGVFLAWGDKVASTLEKLRVTQPLGKLARDFRVLFTSIGGALRLTAWSLFVHLLTILTIVTFAQGLRVDLGFLDALVVIPAVILTTTIPVSVAGWGVREGAMVVGFALVGISSVDALTVSVCFGLAQILIGLPGGLVWLINRPSHQVLPGRDAGNTP